MMDGPIRIRWCKLRFVLLKYDTQVRISALGMHMASACKVFDILNIEAGGILLPRNDKNALPVYKVS